MTPTEQDKELRELLYTLLKTDPRADTYVIPYRVMDIFANFITADRKRVALEARLQEVEVSIIELERSDDPRFYSKDEAIRSQRARYAYLKEELEKL